MLDSLNRDLYPQWRNPDVLRYHAAVIDAAEAMRKANGYEPQLYTVPDDSNIVLAAQQPFEGRISLLALSLVWAISASSSAPAGFTIQITDLGTQSRWFSGKVRNGNLSGVGQNAQGITFPLYILPCPRIIVDPGLLSVSIENLAAAQNTVQVVLHVAEPAWLRPGSNVIYDPNEWNREIEAEADLIKRAVRVPNGGSVIKGTAGGGIPIPAGAAELSTAIIDTDAAGDNTIIPGSGSNRIAIHELGFRHSGVNPMTVRLRQGADPMMGPMTNFNPGDSFFRLAADKPWRRLEPGRSFIINLSAAEQLSGYVLYRMEQ